MENVTFTHTIYLNSAVRLLLSIQLYCHANEFRIIARLPEISEYHRTVNRRIKGRKSVSMEEQK